MSEESKVAGSIGDDAEFVRLLQDHAVERDSKQKLDRLIAHITEWADSRPRQGDRAADVADPGERGDAVQFMLNVAKDAAPMLRSANFAKTADLLDVASTELAAAPRAPSDTQGAAPLSTIERRRVRYSWGEAWIYRDAEKVAFGNDGSVETIIESEPLFTADQMRAAPAQQAPDTVRDRAYDAAIAACDGEKVEADVTGDFGDEAYNNAIEHCKTAIGALKSNGGAQ